MRKSICKPYDPNKIERCDNKKCNWVGKSKNCVNKPIKNRKGQWRTHCPKCDGTVFYTIVDIDGNAQASSAKPKKSDTPITDSVSTIPVFKPAIGPVGKLICTSRRLERERNKLDVLYKKLRVAAKALTSQVSFGPAYHGEMVGNPIIANKDEFAASMMVLEAELKKKL